MKGRSPTSYHWDSQWRWVQATTRRVGVLGSAQPSELVSVNAISPCPCRWLTRGAARPRGAGEPATADNPAKEAETSTQGVSEALGNPSGEGASSAPVMKAGTSHNPEKGKQSAQGKAKQPAQGETPFSLGRVTHSAGQAGQEDPPGGVCGHG